MTALPIYSPLVPPRDVEHPLEIPPASPSHPLRFRKVLGLLRDVRESEDPVQAGIRLFDAVGGIGGEATFQAFARRPEGRRLLRTRPDLVSILGNRAALAALPEGSLGRAYLEFAERNGFAADGLVSKAKTVDRETDATDPHRMWFWERFTMAHDLWHVLTGCDTTGDGEVRLLAFSYAQTPQRGYLILLGLSMLTRLMQPREHLAQWKAWRAGRRAHDLVSVPWEAYLAWPLDEVRLCYAVEVLDR